MLIFFFQTLKSQVVINEIFPAPKAEQTEWIEIYNPNETDFVLNQFYLTNRNSSVYNDLLIRIPANSFIILTRDSALLGEIATCAVYEVKLPVLHNDWDIVTIRNYDSLIIDSVFYRFSSSWSGNSLERIDWSVPAYENSNWAKCPLNDGHTICRSNYNALPEFSFSWNSVFVYGTLRLTIRNNGRQALNNFTYKIKLVLKLQYDEQFEILIDSSVVQIPKNDSSKIEKDLTEVLKDFEFEFVNKLNLTFEYDSIGIRITKTGSLTLNIPKFFSGILINEFMYEAETGCAEFVELYNNTSDTILLKGWKISNHSTGVKRNFIEIYDTNSKIPPKGYFVVIWDSMFFNCFEDLLHSPFIYCSPENFSLKNTGDNIKVFDLIGILQDSLSYSPKWHKYNVNRTRNRSLEKILPSLISNEEENWLSCIDPRGSTPTLPNSVQIQVSEEDIELKLIPNPFSPNKNRLSIFYTLPFKQSRLSVKIFTIDGVEIREILSNELVPAEGEIFWDGLDANKNLVSLGGYVLYLEAIDSQSGKVKVRKEIIGVGY
ncbi:MAG: lamin tail domain-containing protein [Candidatus Kapaibacteriales bacterium]